ncbi:MAG: hypothetical protein GY844_17370 [Bradyrhizobium sp.]|nr:hypothetical protein [Bradyrhizobium sp.]
MQDIAIPSPRSIEDDLEVIRACVHAGDHARALRYCADLLPQAAGDPAVYESAALAFIAAIDSGRGLDELEPEIRHRLLSGMVLQPLCSSSPPTLHHQLAAQHTSGIATALERAARALLPTIQAMMAAGEVSKNLVLLMLLLRHTSLGKQIGQREISRLHLAWVARFTPGDLAIPYNSMFDARTFKRNVADIAGYLKDIREGARSQSDLPLCHWVVFEWLFSHTMKAGDQGQLLDIAIERLGSATAPAEEVAAARSLLVRHRQAGDDTLQQRLETASGDAQLCQIVAEAAALRGILRGNAVSAKSGRDLIESRVWWALKLAGRKLSLPYLRRPRKLRMAVCVSGQLRGYSSAFRSWRNTLLRDVEYDIFVDSWERIGRSGAEPFRSVLPFAGEHFVQCYREAGLQRGLDEIRQRYPLLFRTLAETGRATETALRDFYMTPNVHLDDESMTPFAAYSNQDKMHSKISSSFEMAMTAGGEYDLIVRLRPDKPIRDLCFSWRELLDACRARPVLFADRAFGLHYAGPMIGDQFAIGTPAMMEVYCRTWTMHPPIAACGLLKFPEAFEGHVSLAQICWLHGIDVRRAPILFGPLQDAERLNSNVILECLTADASGRMDRLDVDMIEATSNDLKRTRSHQW